MWRVAEFRVSPHRGFLVILGPFSHRFRSGLSYGVPPGLPEGRN
jgi:hypothetical protein